MNTRKTCKRQTSLEDLLWGLVLAFVIIAAPAHSIWSIGAGLGSTPIYETQRVDG